MTLSPAQKETLLTLTGGEVLFDEPIRARSTIRIGGPAEGWVRPRDRATLKEVIKWAIKEELPYGFLGAGSNTLVRDKGVPGVLFHLAQGFNQLELSYESGEEVFILAGAGVHTANLVKFVCDNGWTGAEWLAGIPGTVGGNVLTNAGTPAGCMADIVEEITTVDRQLRELTIKRKALEFSYRSLKLPRSTAVVQSLIRLKKDDPAVIQERINTIMEKRKATQPYNLPTLGCIFKNPQVKKEAAQTAGESAGALIEEAGLKGVRVGKARVSEMHANFIVNEDGATAREVEILIGLIKERVKQKFGVILETEIRIIGEA